MNDLNPTWDSVFLVGHTPAISEFAGLLLNEPHIGFPTCTVLQVELDIATWGELAPGVGVMGMLDYPKRRQDS